MKFKNYVGFQLIFLTASLVGCGSSEEAEESVTAGVNYAIKSISPWEKVVIPANAGIPAGVVASCTMGAKFPGVSINARNCDLTFDGASPGEYLFQTTLTIQGYSGYASQMHEIVVEGPLLTYGALGSNFHWAEPITLANGKPVLSNYAAVAGDQLRFGVEGPLPQGVTLDTLMGQLSGTPIGPAESGSKLFAELTRNAKSIRLRTYSSLSAKLPSVTVANMTATQNESKKMTVPQLLGARSGDRVSYAISNEAALGGFDQCAMNATRLLDTQVSLDPQTGAVLPNFNTAGVYCIAIRPKLNRNGQEHNLTATRVEFTIK
jgi:hypothetical protein